ncbi:hypothetical protein CVT25_013571 [Psilocybe cyanescens]|uniref:Uncharacterized protein n=1 Tax=Psilocybe cyanescens TaxID=93625 RepID=A0A409XSR4_PSICY|nr:hypothetical protein CVT25_013571 [Psilocybe cyanescens]
MALSRIHLPSISLVLEEEPQWFIPEPESSVLIPIDYPPPMPNQRPPSYLMKPVNMDDEELEGDEHFAFVVHFPEGKRPVAQNHDVVGQSSKEKRPRTSRGFPGYKKTSPPSNTKIKHNISLLGGALRKLYPAKAITITSSCLLRKTIHH